MIYLFVNGGSTIVLVVDVKETEKQLKTSLEDNYTLGKHIEFIEKQLQKALNYGE